jgi:hypothetical protein
MIDEYLCPVTVLKELLTFVKVEITYKATFFVG